MIAMKSRIALAGLIGLLSLSACNAGESRADKAASVKVNGVTVSQARIDLIVKQRVAQGQPDTPELRQAVIEDLVTREAIYQAALKKGVNKQAEVKTQLDFATQSVVVGAFIQDLVKTGGIDDGALKAEYDRIKAEMGDKEYHARHILVKTEDEAKDIVAQLKKGAKFDKLAEKSLDPGSAAAGGDLGWNAAATFVKPFADAMVALNKGAYTDKPVQTQFGWHVILLENSRELETPPFDDVKPQLRQRLEQQLIEKTIGDLRAKAKVEGLPAAEAPAKGK